LSERLIARRTLPIGAEEDIVIVRRAVQEVARERGFDAFAIAAITTAASELARNCLVHGGGGEACLEELEQEGRYGIVLHVIDQGPGIANLERALSGGWSTARSLGLGLSGSRRLVDHFEVESAPGAGTRVKITKWARYRR
jgi:serine/threonine-protein kinase RsbT